MIETATTAEMMELFGLSERSIREHAGTGVMVRVERGRYDLKASIRNYVTHMREAAAGRRTTNEELRAEKIRLTAAQADIAEIAKAVKAGAMVDVQVFEKRWADEMVRLLANLLSLPAKIGTACPQFTPHDILMIDSVLRRMLETIAGEADETVQTFDEANPPPKRPLKRGRKGRR